MRLYELNEKYGELLDAIEREEIPKECVQDMLDMMEGELVDKIDDIVSYIKQLNYEQDMIKQEINALQKRTKAKEKLIDNLNKYVLNSFKINGLDKVETSRNIIRVTKTPPKVVIKDEVKAMEYLENIEGAVRVKKEINKTFIKEMIKNGDKLDFAEMVTGESLRIK